MSRKTLLTLSLILCILTIGTATAFSSGYPAAALGSLNITGSDGKTTKIDYVVVAKFTSGATGFTFTEAETYSELVVTAVTSLLSSSDVTTLTPSQLAAAGISDADAAKSLVANNYKAAGYEVFVFIDIKKAAAVTALTGPNIRLDIYASGLLGDSEMYLASIETAIAYLDLFGSLL